MAYAAQTTCHTEPFIRPSSARSDNSRRSSQQHHSFRLGYLPQLDFPTELDITQIVRRSTIETYDTDDDASESSVTLFHAGYTPLALHAREEVTRQHVPSRTPTARSMTRDPNLVIWDEDDPANPHNWPAHRRWTSTILIALFAFISPMASTMVAPALDTISDDFDIDSEIEQFMVMSIFLLAFAIGPFLWGPLSEVFGRAHVMQGANAIFLVFNTVCGFAKNKNEMMAFRFMAGIGGSAPQAIGGGIISDCFKANQRGLATAIYSLMPFLSPAVAPILGGYMTQYISWRWVFFTTSIFDLTVQIACVLFLRETHHPTILAKKVKALKKETGNQDLHTKWQGPDYTLKKSLMKSCVRPFIMLTTQPALQAMALFRGYQYGLMYLVFATFPMVWEKAYEQNTGRASLNYISLGIGFIVGLQISGLMQDKIYTWCKDHEVDPSSIKKTWQSWRSFRKDKTSEKQDGTTLPLANGATDPEQLHQRKPPLRRRTTSFDPTKGLPEYRLPLVLPFSMLIPIGLLTYGWAAEKKVHWIVPNIGACIFAIGLIVCFNCAQGYVVDTYTTYAASATGAAAFVRTMAGFSFPLFAPKMYAVLGVGWGDTLLAGISATLGLVAPVLLWRYGIWLRSKSTYCTG